MILTFALISSDEPTGEKVFSGGRRMKGFLDKGLVGFDDFHFEVRNDSSKVRNDGIQNELLREGGSVLVVLAAGEGFGTNLDGIERHGGFVLDMHRRMQAALEAAAPVNPYQPPATDDRPTPGV